MKNCITRLFIASIIMINLNSCGVSNELKERRETGYEILYQSQISDCTDQKIRILDDEDQWTQYVDSFRNDKLGSVSNIDFDKEFIAVVCAGTRNTGGYQIKSPVISKEKDIMMYYFEVEGPGKEDLVTMAITQPMMVIRIPYSSNKVICRWK